jgi:phospholipase C
MRIRRARWLGPVGLLLGVVTLAPMASANAKGFSLKSIKHVIVLMQENRSADTYLGQLNLEGQPAYDPEPTTGNPDPLNPGQTIIPFQKTSFCESSDLNHSWNGAHQEYDNGAMDGFTTANDINSANADSTDPSGTRAMGYYDQTDLPFYYSLYNTFATGDRYFSSVMGPTYPNRFYLLAGTSFGHIQNDAPPPGGWPVKTIFDELGGANVKWKVYYSDFPFAEQFAYVQQHHKQVRPIARFFANAQKGTLPAVSFVDPAFLGSKNTETDEHPPSDVQVGQQFVWTIVNALEHSPDWSSSALFITYDEDGGFYDHVPPPAAVVPDNIPPMLQSGDTVAAFDHYGFRVPMVLISPFAKAHFVSHTVYDHTSILKFIETRFNLPALTARDAAADPMLGLFDFANPSFMSPPSFTDPSVTLC